MLALLAANAYLGIEDANLNHIYWFVIAVFILIVDLLLIRLIGLLYAARRGKKTSWTTFYQLAKTRGLNGPQSEVLAIVARQAKISRPPKVLSSIQLLDKAIEKESYIHRYFTKRIEYGLEITDEMKEFKGVEKLLKEQFPFEERLKKYVKEVKWKDEEESTS